MGEAPRDDVDRHIVCHRMLPSTRTQGRLPQRQYVSGSGVQQITSSVSPQHVHGQGPGLSAFTATALCLLEACCLSTRSSGAVPVWVYQISCGNAAEHIFNPHAIVCSSCSCSCSQSHLFIVLSTSAANRTLAVSLGACMHA